MPQAVAIAGVPSLKFLATQQISLQRSSQTDFRFLKDVIADPINCCDFNGSNTKLLQEARSSTEPKAKVVYLSLIDMTPRDPNTMLTAITKSLKSVEEAGQSVLVFS